MQLQAMALNKNIFNIFRKFFHREPRDLCNMRKSYLVKQAKKKQQA